VDTSLPMHITVLHNAALDEAKELAERVRSRIFTGRMFISIVSRSWVCILAEGAGSVRIFTGLKLN
jgi:uncharacterized protein (DUF1919 family)